MNSSAQTYRSASSNTRKYKLAWSEMAYLHKQYSWAPWTRKGCAVCNDTRYQLHHVAYRPDHPAALAHIVPLCNFHHRDFSVNVWPPMREWLPLPTATLLYVTHGTAVHEWKMVTETPHPGVSVQQMSLF